MNAEELIEEVANTILDTSYDSEVILGLLNKGQMACASRVLLPGLADGTDTIDTVADDSVVDLPEDFHRELFAASIDGQSIKIHDNKAIMLMVMGHDTSQAGDVSACCISGRSLFYMDRPALPVTIDLSYYRKPVPMTESSNSYPDGMIGESEVYDSTLIAYACWKLFAKIEQGLEGNKTDSIYHKNEFEQGLLNLDKSFAQSRPRRPPIVCRVNW